MRSSQVGQHTIDKVLNENYLIHMWIKSNRGEPQEKFKSKQRLPIAFIALTSMALIGCSTIAKNQLKQSHLQLPIRVWAVQSPIIVEPDRFKALLVADTEPKLPVPDESIAQAAEHAQERAQSAMTSALSKDPSLFIVTPPLEEIQFISQIQSRSFGSAITQDEANHIQAATGADALLRYAITDYGLTPKAWRNGYIAFEVTTTLALAAVIAYSSSQEAKAAAGIYLVQEAAEETATAYAGFWALDEVCRPVRIEAELIRLHPLNTLWETRNTGLSDVKLSRLFRKVSVSERDKQLDQATDNSVKQTVSNLFSALEYIKP